MAGGTIAILGTGAVATALGRRLSAPGPQKKPGEEPGEGPAVVLGGGDVLLWGRDPARAADLARRLGARAAGELAQLAGAEVTLLCVADRAIGELAADLARAVPGPGVALHTSGFHGAGVLAPLARAGWSVGGMHPLVSFPAGRPDAGRPDDRRLTGAWYGLCGDGPARSAARALVRRLDGRELTLAEGGRAAYHGAAALAANGLVALVDLALETLGEAAPPEEAGRALANLCAGVLEDVGELGPRDALTGAVVRGDAAVVEGHLEVLPPAPREAYCALLARMLDLARARGVDPAALAGIEGLLRT